MELLRALGSLIETPSEEHGAVARAVGLPRVPTPAVHGRIVAFQRRPCASIYLGADGMMGGDVRDRAAGFRRALKLEACSEPDHLASLLTLAAGLGEWRGDQAAAGDDSRAGGAGTGAAGARAGALLLAQARATLAWEHLSPWIRPYLASFERCGSPFYEAWAELLERAMDALEGDLGLPDYLPVSLRDAPELPDPRAEGGEAFVRGLLAPARAGIVVTRDDLNRLAGDLGLACRAGERRYALVGFLSQDAAGTLAWLSDHAERWASRMTGRGPRPIAAWWTARAAGAAGLLARLAEEARSVGAAVP